MVSGRSSASTCAVNEAPALTVPRSTCSNAHFVADLDTIAKTLPGDLRDGDLVLTLGAGSISSLGPLLLEQLEASDE